MLIDDLCPKTLDGVKSLASQFCKEQGLKYSRALDLAAKRANCENFRHAQRVLPVRGTSPARPYVLLTRYWSDKKQGYRCGRETLKVELSKPILDICSKYALKHVRGFSDLRMVADDHFICDDLAETQGYARRRLCTAARSLRFMEHTGLQPFRDARKVQNYYESALDTLPNRDHATDWVDPETGQFVLIDEPYGRTCEETERAAWSEKTGWQVVKTSWPGIYNPYDCDFYVVADGRSGYDLDALVTTINAMPAPLAEGNWAGESVIPWDAFTSPMAKTEQDLRRARCRGKSYPLSNAMTIPYSHSLGEARRRPAAKMDIDEHVEAGRIIRAVIRSDQGTYAIDNRMNSLRATLEDWMCLEIGRGNLKDFDVCAVYYDAADGDLPYREKAKSRSGIVAMLGALRQKLQAAYPNCAPLRQQLRRIDVSVSLIDKMKPAAV